MIDTNFRSYYKKLQTLCNEASEQAKKINATWKQAQKDYEDVKTGNSIHTDIVIAEYKYIKAKEAYERDMDALKLRVFNSRFAYEDAINKLSKEFFKTNPDKVDEKALKLLEMGVMSDTDLEQLANKYRNNPTMLRVIQKHAEGRDTDGATKLRHRLKKELNEKRVIDDFNELSKLGACCTSSNDYERILFDRRFNEKCEEALKTASDYEIIEAGTIL